MQDVVTECRRILKPKIGCVHPATQFEEIWQDAAVVLAICRLGRARVGIWCRMSTGGIQSPFLPVVRKVTLA